MNIVTRHRRGVPALRPDFIAAAAVAVAVAFGAVATPAQAIPTAGACCKPDGSCHFLPQSDCLTHSGTYQGDTIQCVNVTCPQPTTTTGEPPTTTMVIKGACCAGTGCYNESQDYCEGELQGTWNGEATSCDDPGVCVNCGDGCQQYGETCDDANTQNGDGCDEKCGEEACYKCYVAESDTRNVIVPFCFGPSTCIYEEECGFCGDGITGPGEQCDDGDTVSADCCDADCEVVPGGTDCADGIFCDGAESCDGSGNCVEPAGGADCSGLDDECAVGVCDPKADACIADTDARDGDPCESTTACTVDNSGECAGGECVGEGTTLSPSCRWIVCGASSGNDVNVKAGDGSFMNASACGDTATWAGATTAHLVATATTGEGAYFYGPSDVAGDIVTGGSTIGTSLYEEIPGTLLKDIATGQTVAKDPSGAIDTTGAHDLVDVCNDDQAALTAAIPVLAAMGDPDDEIPGPNGLKIVIGASDTIDVTGQGLAVIDVNGLNVRKDATLTIRGSATDVLLLRVDGPLRFGYGSQLILDTIPASSVVIYGMGSRCRFAPGVVGMGTVFCPSAGRFVVGAGVNWSGTFLGGLREVQVRSNAELTHVAFTGF